MEDQFISIKDAAAYLRVHVMTMYKLASKTGLPLIKVGKQWKTKKDWLEKYLMKDTVGCLPSQS